MRRRRCLQATALALTGGLAGSVSSERISEFAGTVQAIVSDVDGGGPEAAALGEAFAESTGECRTRYHSNVSMMVGSW